MKRRIFSFLLAVVMVLSLAPSVFAAEEPKITVAVDKTSVKAGETVTFTYESTAAVAEMTNLDVCLAYDGDVFEYVSVDTENSVWFENPRVRSRYTLLGYPMFRLSEDKDDEEDVDAGKMFSVTFRALETITDVKEASFYNHDSLTVWEYEWEEHKAVDGCRVSIRNDLTEEEQSVALTGGIGARGESSQNILLQSRYCGRLRVRISRFTLLDYLGMLPMQAPANAEARLTILPNLFPMDADMTARPAYADDGASDRRGEDRSEVYQLREYRPGDDIRQIHWKLSSKLDELILKEASQPESRSLLVFWDKRTGTPQQMDALAEVVSSTGAALLQGGVQYTLSWTEGDDLQAQDILDENQLLQAIPELVKTRGSADCRLPEMGDYSRILYFGVKPEERMMTDERVHFVLCTDEPFPDATTFTPQNYSETMQRLEV